MGTGNSDYQIGRPSHDYAGDLIATKGSRDRNYLQVKHRLQLLRELFPEARISTSSQMIDPEHAFACFHAVVELPNGARGEGTGSETGGDFRDYIEKAETKAIGRALSAAGIGHQYGIADFEYESESPREYNGVDSGVNANRPRSAAGRQAPAPTPEDIAAGRNAQLVELQGRLGKDETKRLFEIRFANTTWKDLDASEQDAFLVELREKIAASAAPRA